MAELVDAHDSKSCFARSESSILSSPTKIMELNKFNSLVELFFEKYKENKKLTNQPFLKWLKTNENDFFTWEQVKNNICLFF